MAETLPEQVLALKAQGHRARDAGQSAEAIQALEAAARLAPDDFNCLLDLAPLYERAGRLADVWTTYQSALRLAPRDLRAVSSFLGFLVRAGRVEGIMPLFQEALSLGWVDVTGMAALGAALLPRFQYTEAEQVFRAALAIDPGHETAAQGLGIALNGLKQFEASVACLRKVADPAPGQPVHNGHIAARVHLLAAQAGVAMNAGAWTEAARLFAASLDLERRLLPQTVPAPEQQHVGQRQVHRLLYIEIELKAREFDARVLLALHAAAQGLDVVIGQKSTIAQYGYAKLPAGIFLVKTMNGMDVIRIKDAAASGHMVVVLDEEAFGGSGRRALWMRLNTDPQALPSTDLIIAQGREYADLLASVFPETAAKTRVLGNPRVDLYRPAFRKTSGGARQRILVCAQSQVCNPKALSFPDLMAFHLRGVPMGEDIGAQVVEGTKEVFGFELSIIPQLQAATSALAAAFPDADILFRPHPAEDPGLWARAFAGHANVTVSSAGSLADALEDARALIYVRGCATGLEAHFQGVPIIRFDGDGGAPEPGNWISSGMGFPARSPADVIVALERIEAGETTWTQDQVVVAANFHGDGDSLVCVGVAKALAATAAERARPDPSARAALHGLAGRKTVQREFDIAKFPATSVAEVEALATRLAAVAGLSVPRIEAFAHNVFLFQGAGA